MKETPQFAAWLTTCRKVMVLTLVTFSLCRIAVGVRAADVNPPQLLSYQGFLTDGSGAPLGQNGPVNYNVVFRVFDNQSGGNLLWAEIQTVTVDQGQFSVILGEGSANPGDPRPPLNQVFAGTTASDRFLEMTVTIQGNPLTILPRLRYLSSPYAFLARQANALVSPNGVELVTTDNGVLNVNGVISRPGTIANSATSGASANIANALVARDGTGSFSASNLVLGGGLAASAVVQAAHLQAKAFRASHDQGAHLEWNRDGGGQAWLLNHKGQGVGGMILGGVDNGRGVTRWMTLNSGGNVGVGTPTPQGRFEVQGNNPQLVVDGPAGGISQLLLYLGGGLKSGFSHVGSDSSLRIFNNGVDAITAASGGRVNMAYGATARTIAASASVGSHAQGIHLEWNRDGGSGYGYVLNQRGGGIGGMIFGAVDTANSMSEWMRINHNGNVGIGTTDSSSARLVVAGAGEQIIGNHYTMTAGAISPNAGSFQVGDVSILTSHAVHAPYFRAISDERVKVIQGRSNGESDLSTLRQIEVTDYTYRDVLTRGNLSAKKLIGQQLEKVYPQAVVQVTDVVPDIYKRATIKGGWVQLDTDLEVGERVKLIGPNKSGVFEVLEVTDGAFRSDLPEASDGVFVFGRKVDDFRVVDYEAVSMLNVSATQELARRVDSLERRERNLAELEEKAARVESLERELAELKKMVTSLVSNQGTVHQIAAGEDDRASN